MGKSQYKKKLLSKQRRHNPLKTPEGHGAAAGPGSSEEVLPIIKKLSSSDATERTWSLSALHHLTQSSPTTRRLFLTQNIVSHLIQRLTDPVPEVVVEATGALRNLGLGEGDEQGEVGEEMGKWDVLTPLASVIGQISKTLQIVLQPSAPPPATDMEALTRRLVFPLAENVISILQILSETSNKTLRMLNAVQLPDGLSLPGFLMSLLQPGSAGVVPESCVLAVAQCLYSLTSDNPPFLTLLLSLPQSQTLEILLPALNYTATKPESGKKVKSEGMEVDEVPVEEKSGESEDGRLIRVLIAGTLRNSSPAETPLVPDLDKMYILPLVLPMLDVNLEEVVIEVEKSIGGLPNELDATLAASRSLLSGSGSEPISAAQKSIDHIERHLSTLVTALEVLSSMCAGLGEVEESATGEGEWEDGDEGMDMEEEEDEEMLIARGRDQAPGMEVEILNAGEKSSTPLEVLAGLGLHARLMQLVQPTRLSFPPPPAPVMEGEAPAAVAPSHPPITALLSAVHLRALEALNNLFLTISSFAPSPTPPLSPSPSAEHAEWNTFVRSSMGDLQAVWDGTFEVAVGIVGNENGVGMRGMRRECLEILGGVWWGLVRVGGMGVLVISEQQIQMIIQSFGMVAEDEGRSRVINALSGIAMRPEVTVAENQAIGSFLLSIVQSLSTSPGSTSPGSIVAALNALFDIYSDERSTYDAAVFVQGGFLAGLVKVVGKVKGMVKAIDRRKQSELREAAEEIYDNLLAFIKYRRSVA